MSNHPMHPWEQNADEISKAGWTYGYRKIIGSGTREMFVADAHRSDGHRYVSQAETLLTPFQELRKMLEVAVS